MKPGRITAWAIQKVQWDSGPSAANQVTPYFERPIVWG